MTDVREKRVGEIAMLLSDDGSRITLAGPTTAVLLDLRDNSSTVLAGHRSFVYHEAALITAVEQRSGAVTMLFHQA